MTFFNSNKPNPWFVETSDLNLDSVKCRMSQKQPFSMENIFRGNSNPSSASIVPLNYPKPFQNEYEGNLETDDLKISRPSGQSQFGLIQYVVPLLKMLHWLCFIPSSFVFDRQKNSHVRVDGGFLRKVVTGILQISAMLYLWNNLRRLTSAGNSDLGLIYVIMYVCFMCLSSTFFSVMWRNAGCINTLLVRIECLCVAFKKDKDCQFPKRQFTRTMVWTLIFMYGLLSIFFTVAFEITHGTWNGLGSPEEFLITLTKEAEFNIHYGTGGLLPLKNMTAAEETIYYTMAYTLVVGVPYFIVVFYGTATWMYAFLLTLLWGLLFRKLFQLYFKSLRRSGATLHMLRFVRLFQQITILMEDYNRIFGLNILFCVTSCILFTSNHAWDVFGAFTSNIVLNLAIGSAFVTFASILVICSEINNQANAMSMFIKICYQQKREWQLLLDDGNGSSSGREELTQGLSMIQHDLQANTIGLKGYGFFTISYSFMGTVISVLVTYSVMIQQWQKSSPQSTKL